VEYWALACYQHLLSHLGHIIINSTVEYIHTSVLGGAGSIKARLLSLEIVMPTIPILADFSLFPSWFWYGVVERQLNETPDESRRISTEICSPWRLLYLHHHIYLRRYARLGEEGYLTVSLLAACQITTNFTTHFLKEESSLFGRDFVSDHVCVCCCSTNSSPSVESQVRSAHSHIKSCMSKTVSLRDFCHGSTLNSARLRAAYPVQESSTCWFLMTFYNIRFDTKSISAQGRVLENGVCVITRRLTATAPTEPSSYKSPAAFEWIYVCG
jgi:hypothetical protein